MTTAGRRKTMLFGGLALVLCACAAGGEVRPRHAAEQATARYFERAKKNEATLVAMLHRMPKGADLHNHLWGTIEAEALLATALEKGLYFDRMDKAFTVDRPAGPYFTPEAMTANFWQRAEVLEAVGMRNYRGGTESGHQRFFRSFYRFAPAVPPDSAMLRDICVRAVEQRVSHLELMHPPTDDAWLAEADRVRLAVLAEYAERGLHWDLSLRFIYPLDRNTPLDQFRAALETAAAAATRGGPTVAITILSPEDDHISQRDFFAQMDAIDDVWNAYAAANASDPGRNPPPPKFTLHAGELTLDYATYRSMRDRIWTSLRKGHASRIGHGTSVMWEEDVYGLLGFMRAGGRAVEICPSSSEGILGVAGGDRHPFRLYWDAGVPVVVATDDEGVSRSNLTLEFAKAARWFDLSYAELKWLAHSSLEYSFLSGESLYEGGDFNRVRADAPDLVHRSEKARKQWDLREAFVKYECEMATVVREFGWDGK